MLFYYSVIRPDGKMIKRTISATSLRDAKKHLQKNGIIIQSISSKNLNVSSKIYIGLGSTLIALILVFFVFRPTNKNSVLFPRESEKIAIPKENLKLNNIQLPQTGKIFTPQKNQLKKKRKIDSPKIKHKKASNHFEIAHVAATLPLKPGIRRYRTAEELLADTNAVYQTPPLESTLRSSTEHNLKLIAGVNVKNRILPLPPGIFTSMSENDFFTASTNIIVIWDEDDDHTATEKTRIAELKEEMIFLVNSGSAVAEAFEQLYREHNERADLYQTCKREYIKLLAQGKEAEAEQFKKDANEELTNYGAPKIED